MFDQLRCRSVWARVELGRIRANLLQGFVVEKAAGIFRQVQLLTLDLLSEFPATVSIQDWIDNDTEAYMLCATNEDWGVRGADVWRRVLS